MPRRRPTRLSIRSAARLLLKQNAGGTIRVADSTNFKVATNVASALVTVPPGGIREMHWHPNADEWQYYIKGKAG